MRQLSMMTRAERQAHSCRESRLESLNLDGLDLSGLDFSWSDFRHVSFVGACLQDTDFSDTLFTDCSLAGADLSGADLHGAALRGCDLNHAVLKGADLYRANLEGARLNGIVDDEKTRFFRLYCPERGPFWRTRSVLTTFSSPCWYLPMPSVPPLRVKPVAVIRPRS